MGPVNKQLDSSSQSASPHRKRKRVVTVQIPNGFFLFIFLRLDSFCFRLNGGFGPNAFGLSVSSLFFLCLFSVSLSLPTKWRLWNTFGFSALSPIISLHRSLLLTLSLARFHFRLTCGFGAGSRRNAFGFSVTSIYVSRSIGSLF
jgi:hypothetical protein